MGSSPKITSTSESMDAVMKAMTDNVVPYSEAVRKIILPTEQDRIDANKVILPQEQAINFANLAEYLPKYTALDSQTQAQRAAGTVGSDAAALDAARKTGLVENALSLQQQVDPEYFKTRQALGAKLADLAAFDPNKLSGSEVAEISRGMTQQASGAPNLGAALQAAGTFGSALAKRRGENNSFIQTIAGSMPMLRTGFDPYQVATGKNSGPGQAAAGNRGYNDSYGQTAQGYAGNVFNSASGFQQQKADQAFKAPTGFDTAMKAISGVSSVVGALP